MLIGIMSALRQLINGVRSGIWRSFDDEFPHNVIISVLHFGLSSEAVNLEARPTK
jgi:hypothetical protein